jgi:hypothetical protein
VTPKQLTNIKKSFPEADELDGYEDLNEEDQAKIVKAYEDGHVADEDIPDSARKPEADEDEDEDGEPKPKKKAAPKKKKVEGNDDDDAEAEAPPKKKRAPPKKKATAAADAPEGEEKPKAKRAPPRKKAQVSIELTVVNDN